MMKNFLNSDREFRLNEILFESRNKEYGAYVLRSEEGLILRKALFIGVSFFITLVAVPLLINNLTPETVIPTNTFNPHQVIIPDEPEIPKPTKPETQPQTQQQVKTIQTAVPTPTKDAIKETPSPTIKDYESAVPGLENKDGETPKNTYNPPVINTGPPTTPTIATTVPPKNQNIIEPVVDVKADFVGGIEAFRKKVSQEFDISEFDGSGEKIAAKVTFVVEKNGSISDVKVSGPDAQFNKEAERTIKSIKGKWIPAKLDGEMVRSYFSIPISMQFE